MQGLIHNSIFEKAVLLDTSALYALTDSRDQYHTSAIELLGIIQQRNLPIFITNAVIIETYRLILHKLGKTNAQKFLETLIGDIKKGVIKIERMSENDEEEGQQIIFNNKGHALTLTDTINFSVMLRMGIYKMFGFDSDCCVVGLELFSV